MDYKKCKLNWPIEAFILIKESAEKYFLLILRISDDNKENEAARVVN